MSTSHVRNFCIIAHIDHGKSTLADRFLEVTHTVEDRKMKQQLLDTMELEQERGITIKLQPVHMHHGDYELNLIDTPGHVDFSYEVSRSLAAVEGAILLVDASQGIQAQTLANLYLAIEQNLTIIPVLNKIDLPAADPEKVTREIVQLIGCDPSEVLRVSAKTGEGVAAVLDRVVAVVPAPADKTAEPLQALIFDSYFDEYRGVVADIRVMAGQLKKGDPVRYLATGAEGEVLDVGTFQPQLVSQDELSAGDIGYVVTGLKDVSQCRVGDTIGSSGSQPLQGYREAKPMVFAGLFCKEGNDYPQLRTALDKLKLSDAALTYEAEHSSALGYGFRCGFLGMLHLDIVRERLLREYDLDLLITVPSVAYRLTKTNGDVTTVTSPEDLPADVSKIELIEEPVMKVDVVCPKDYIGAVMDMIQKKRGRYQNTEYLDETVALLHYEVPLATLIVDFYDKLKSVSQGYASLNYDFLRFEKTDVARMDILVAGDMAEALSSIIYRDEAHAVGKHIVAQLKETLPRQMFEVKIQAAIGSTIVASERLSAMRKDVTAKLYGGDVTRKRKLLEKQKKGKKRMAASGKVDIPPEAFMAVLKR